MSAFDLVPKFLARAKQEGLASAMRAGRSWVAQRAHPQRADGSGPFDPAPLGAGQLYRVDEFIFFRGQLWLQGQVSAALGPVSQMALHVPGAQTLGVRFESRRGRDSTFSVRLRTNAPAASVAAATLKVDFWRGKSLVIGDLGVATSDPAHALMSQFLREIGAQPSGKLLEVGSRARSGIARRDLAPAGWTYEGLDVVPGPNVDTVGDAHQISRMYPPESFDAVMSISVLEHLLMPWKFVVELNRVLKVGAIGIFATHQCWPLHDEPWDFWRFSDNAWPALLNPMAGFEIIDAQMGEPAHVVANKLHAATAFSPQPAGALASFVLFRKIGDTTLDWPVELTDVIESSYPLTARTVGEDVCGQGRPEASE